MNKIKLIMMALAIAATGATAGAQATAGNTIADHEDAIYEQEKIVDATLDSIKVVEGQIAALKARIDSLNALEKELKAEISSLEKVKKGLNNDIKTANKTREEAFDRRDNLVYETEVVVVLTAPFNKQAVEEALKSFDGMETKDVLKKKELVENYGRYTAELRDLMSENKPMFVAAKWQYTGSETEQGKKFHKALKSTKYYKIYEKGMKNPTKVATIPYLDEVMESILQLERSGFTSEKQYDQVASKLYE